MSRIRRVAIALALGSVLLAVLALYRDPTTSDRTDPSRVPWTFVADQAYPPLSSLVNGVPQGLDVDLVRELGRVLGREIRLELLPYDEAQRRVLAGEADALTDLAIMPERRALFEFSDATITHEFGFFVRRGETSVRGVADLAGKRVGVTSSPFVPGYLQRQSDATLVTVNDFANGFERLVNGELDVVAYDSWVAAPMARQHLNEVTLVGVPFTTNATAIAVKKGRHDLLDEINRGVRQLKASGTLQRLESKWRPREMLFLSGTLVERAVQWAGAAILLVSSGAMAAWVISLKREIRRRERVEDRLRQSQKMDAVGRLAAGVAHDFNNLLTVILGSCEIAGPLLPGGHRARAALDDIRLASERAASLTGQLLAFSRRQVLQPILVDLNAAVRDAQPLLGRLIGEDVAIDLVLDGNAGWLEIDPGQLQQVLMNLSVNARDAMPDGGRLRFATSRLDDRLCLEVSDTGAGIAPAQMAHIFEPFFTTKGEGQGTGLGLATVHGIVTATRGTITVDSPQGHGARFKLTWPRIAKPAVAPPARPPVSPAPSGTLDRILIVEDEADLREMLVTYLGQLGYTVLSANSGEDAVALFETQTVPLDLLVTDVVMTGMNGRQLAEVLTGRQPGLPVLFLSGYTDDVILKHGVGKGDSFLQKPFTLAVLAATVRQILDRDRVSSG
ncbi:MAG: transporter substrate-binding domain-containing protein [Vicinamibacterales bacterium]